MLDIRHLNKNFDGVQAVQDFSLSLQSGKITSLIGPNGAGKTTVFNVVTGFLPATSGEASLDGRSLNGLAPWRIARQGISRTFQNLRLFKKLTVIENVLLGRQEQSGEGFVNALLRFSDGSQEHRSHLTKARELLEFVGLGDHQSELAEHLSYGQQKLLSIACCLAAEPELLLLDEPVSGIQPVMIQKIESILKHLVFEQGKTVWLIEHDIEFVLRISDLVVVMDDGKKIAEDTPAVIQNSPEILEAYLS
jgi:ABC-type branched-subunit amino acid transport system ATPase component